MRTSEEIKQIIPALVKVQSKIEGMRPDASNPFFKNKYITLDGILEYVRPILTKEGVLVIQNASSEGEYAEVTTTLMHESGEYIQTDVLKLKPSKSDAQQIGSAITYAKRYQLSALLGISSEIDDDGNQATHGQYKQGKVSKTLTDAQINRFYAIAKSRGIDAKTAAKTVVAKYGVSPNDMTREQYDEVCNSLESK